MTEQIQQTSYKLNQSAEIFGKLRLVSLKVGMFAILFAAFAVLVLQDVFPNLLPIIFTSIIVGSIALTQLLVGGRFDWENLEKHLQAISSMTGLLLFKRDMDIAEKSGFSRPSDDEMNIFDNRAGEIIGFKLKPDEAQFEERFSGSFDSIIKSMPVGTCVYVLRNSRPGSHTMRLQLQEKGVCSSESFVFFRLPTYRFGIATAKKNLIESLSRIAERMNAREISAAIEQIVEPGRISSNALMPLHKGAARLGALTADFGIPGKSVAAMSLASLPKLVDRRFSDLWNVFQRLPGSICVRFEAIPPENLLKNVFKTLWRSKLGLNKTGDDVDRDFVTLAMHAGGLIHGTQKEITQALEVFESEIMRVPEQFRPIFGRDSAFLKESLLAIIPGTLSKVPFRKINVINAREAYQYLPKPLPSVETNNPDLDLRLASNTRLCLQNNVATPTFLCGGMEGGKSTLLSFIILSHIQRGLRGESVASFVCEAGDSFVFLREGPADVVFSLGLENEKIVPLQDHPLRMLLSWGDPGLEAAQTWICDLMGLDKENLARESKVVFRALVRAREFGEFRLSQFLDLFRKELAVLDESVIKNPDHPFRKYSSKLEMFAAGSDSQYGRLFDPENTSDYNYETARHFYFVKAEGSRAFGELDKPFFALANAVASVLETRFSPKSPQPAENLVVFDEIHFYRQYVTQKSLSDVNRQGRKLSKFLYYATQTLADGVIDGENEDKKYSLLETCKRFFFIDLGANKSLWMRALKLNDENDPVLLELERVAQANIEARSRGEYSWGFVDEHKRVYQFFLDMSKEALWGCTTHPGGIALRREALKTGLGYFEVCEKLAEKVWPIPRGGNLSADYLSAQMWNVFDIKPPEKSNGSANRGPNPSGA